MKIDKTRVKIYDVKKQINFDKTIFNCTQITKTNDQTNNI